MFPKEIAVGRCKVGSYLPKMGKWRERERKIKRSQMKAGAVPKVSSIYDLTRSTIIPTATST